MEVDVNRREDWREEERNAKGREEEREKEDSIVPEERRGEEKVVN